jgi:thiol-disulfide isomerase/thioredoxin
MPRLRCNLRALACALLLALPGGAALTAEPTAVPEFTHQRPSEWLNTEPLTLAKLKGKVVLVEFWAFECVNCLNSHAWIESVATSRAPNGLVVVGVHTPELPEERDGYKLRAAVQKLQIHYPVMIDVDRSYWNALHNKYWPEFYLIGRDGKLYGSFAGEMHAGEPRAQAAEQSIDQLLAAPAT